MKITSIERGSIAEELGIRSGDELLEVNGHRILDAIDYRFREGETSVSLSIARGREVVIYDIEKEEGEPVGIDFEEMKILSCGNDCIFCFVDQNPSGLRKQLYFRDGDYRLSFMYGNYTTMTNAGPAIIDRIITQRLSPQYISVHVTDLAIRKRLMGLTKDDQILEKIRRLHDNGIDMHTQIVLCPGINDGAALEKTVFDLYQFNERIVSLAVVPVGLTDHRFGLSELKRADPAYAEDLLKRIEPWQKRFRAEIGRAFVYPSDEFLIVAGRKIPRANYYDGFPQVENGVGLVRTFLEDFRKQSRRFPDRLPVHARLTMATGELAVGFIRDQVLSRLKRIGELDVTLEVIPNELFGRSVTVAGLLSAKCLYSALKGSDLGDLLLLPPDLLNADGLFLDDATPAEIEERLQVPVLVFDGAWGDVFHKLNNSHRDQRNHTLVPLPTGQHLHT